jgi:hypothetical protein
MTTVLERAVGRPQPGAARGRKYTMNTAQLAHALPGRRSLAAFVAGALASALLVIVPGAALAATSANGFNPTPARLLDTRPGTTVGGAPAGQIQGLTSVTLPSSVPTGSTAVLTVTATGSAGSGFVQVYPTGTAPSTTSNVNFDKGSTAPDSVLVATPADGRLSIFVGGSPADLVVDLSGYVPATAFTAVTAARIGDTRDGTGFATGKASGTQTLTLPASIPSTAGLVALTVTATQASSEGNVVVWPGGAVPATSNVNFTPGRTQANLVLVKPSADGKVSFKVNGGPTDLVVDVGGYTPAGSSFTAVDPTRVADSRTPIGLPAGPIKGAVTLTLPSTVPAGTSAVLLNVTATDGSGPGYVAVYPAGAAQPATSNVNYDKGVTGANLVLVPVGTNNSVTLFVGGAGANLVVDLSGYVAS